LHFEGLCLRHFFCFFRHFYFHVVDIFLTKEIPHSVLIIRSEK
jgi:hypothetical protein